VKKNRLKHGRPAKVPEERYSARQAVCVQPDEKRHLMREAQQAGITQTDYIRRILSAWLNSMAELRKPRKASGDGTVAPEEQRSASLIFNIRPAEHIQLMREAQQAGVTQTDYIRRILSARLNNMAGLSEPSKASDDGTVTVKESRSGHGRSATKAPEELRSAHLRVNVRPSEKMQLTRKAQQAGETVSTYIYKRHVLSAMVNNMAGLSEPPKASVDGTIAPEEQHSAEVMICVRPDEKRQLKREAQQAGLSKSTYMHLRLFGEGK
jgi:predicted HicB family RNase H-like nuclease